MRYKGLIFDFNGVLWWDSHLQEQAWAAFAAALRKQPLSAAEIAEHIHGRTNQHSLSYLLDRPVRGDELLRLTQEKERLYRELCLEQGDAFQLSPGAIPLLEELQARAIPHTIATASEKTNLDFFIEHLALARWFDPALIVYDDGRRPGKPAPDIYQAAAQRLGLAPAHCVVVEDALSGIKAARGAGIGRVLALGPDPDALRRQPGVDAAITSLGELPLEDLFGA